MLLYKNKPLDENVTKIDICNYLFTYNNLPKNVLKYLGGINCICMASCFNLSSEGRRVVNYTHIGYYKNISDFLSSDRNNWAGIHSFYFLVENDESKANLIIQEIKNEFKTHLLNK